jgi:hypothetical protein
MAGEASLHNRHLRFDVDPNGGRMVVSARVGNDFVPVLRRVGRNAIVGGGLCVSVPEQCTVEVTRFARGACLVARGTVPGGALSVAAWLDDDATWLGITETLILDKGALPVAELSASWELASFVEPGELFSPHLTPEDDDVIGVHALRSPVLVAQDAKLAAALVLDTDALEKQHVLPPFIALLRNARPPTLVAGLVGQEVRGHVFFRATHEPVATRELSQSYELFVAAGPPSGHALAEARRRVWAEGGKRRWAAVRPLRADAAELARDVYPQAFAEKWREARIDGRRVGAITTDRAFPGDVWMCPWFHNLATAYGLYAWGEKLGRTDWLERAGAVRELHFAAPAPRGLFPTLYVFGEGESSGRWVGSHPQGGGLDVLHLADMSYTMYWQLLFERDLFRDARTLERARAYLDALGSLLRPDGGLPAYVACGSHDPVTRVDLAAYKQALFEHPGGDGYITDTIDRWGSERFLESAEDGASLMFVAELLASPAIDGALRAQARDVATRLARFIVARVVEPAWYVDMEVHWSCAPNPLGLYDRRSGQHPQNLLAVYMAAEGLLRLYESTGDAAHLGAAARAMDRLSLYQQVWSPPFLRFDAFGGYPAQNTDGEWSDARQALFVITHHDFYRVTGEREHIERARAACRASFATLFHPAVCDQYPVGWSRTPAGFAAENHAHGGHDSTCGVSSFHWGTGSALMAAAYLDRRGIAAW